MFDQLPLQSFRKGSISELGGNSSLSYSKSVIYFKQFVEYTNFTEEILSITAVSGQGNQAKPLWYWCSVIISLTPLFSMILYSSEISFSQVDPTTRQPIVTLNRRRTPKLRHKGGAKNKQIASPGIKPGFFWLLGGILDSYAVEFLKKIYCELDIF